MKEKIVQEIKSIIKKTYSIDLEDLKIDIPPKKEFGDFAFGTFVLAKYLKKNPNEIAENLAKELEKNDFIEKTKISGAYINFEISKKIFTDSFDKYFEKFNKNKLFEKKGETIIVDYIGANVGKPMHIGHMCTPNLGQTMVNLNKKLGYNVISDSHIGDWGIIFGKLICAYKLWGEEKKLEENAVEHLFELYVKITSEIEKESEKGISDLEEKTRQEFKKLSSGDEKSIKYWQSFTSESIKSMQVQLDRLQIKSDFNIGESFYEGLNLPKLENYPDLKYSMTNIVEELINKKIATLNVDKSVGVEFDKKTKIPSCILAKRDGTHGYFASDLACIKYRIENWNPKKIIYFTDVRQSLHFRQAFNIAENAGWLDLKNNKKTELFHAPNGFISLKDGAMSTRKGRIIKLDKLLDEAEKRAKDIILSKGTDIKGQELDELSKIIGIGAIKYGYLKKSRETDIIFDWDEFMSFEGNSGPYIQYAYVRANKILNKYEEEKINKQNLENTNFENNEEIDLVKKLMDYSEILEETSEKNMPHILCKYIFELTKIFSSFYNNIHILNEKNEEKKFLRIKLLKLFSKTLKDSFGILAIDLPEKM